MPRLSFNPFVLMGLVLTLVVSSSTAFAQQTSQDEALNKAKSDLENLYQQWRREYPKSTLNYEAFASFLQSPKIAFVDKYAKAPMSNSLAVRGLPSGGVLVRISKAESSYLIDFTIEADGLDYLNPTPERHHLIMDEQGHVVVSH